jgi:phage terminase large subunit GpA-like protein
MDCLSATHPCQRVVLMFGAQLGKTEAGSNWLGYIIHHAPGPLLAVQPTLEMAKRLSRQRLESMFQDTPVLAERIAPARSRDSGNTLFSKDFAGGIMILTGANSATGLRSMPCRYVFADELDAWPLDAEGEGDPLELAERRTSTFARRKILITSTPTIKDFSRIEREYLRSDQRVYEVPCLSCGHFQALRWQQVRWETNDPSTAKYECESCGDLWHESAKTSFLPAGRWRATADGDGGRTVGFQLSSLYSPIGWRGWTEIVEDFLRARKDANTLKVWVNTTLGLPFEDEYAAKLSAEGLLARALADPYKAGTVPAGGVLLVGAVDVQDTWLEVSVWAVGVGEEMWLVWHQKLEGDPAQDHVWKQVDAIRTHQFPAEVGGTIGLMYLAVDTGGHFTSEAYQYCRSRGSGCVPIKGSSQRNAPPLGKGNKIDVNWKGRQIKKGVTLYSIGTNALKSTIYARLRHSDPGPGYFHFGELGTQEYLTGLTCERLAIRHVKGFPVREWIKPNGARNEPLDLLVYCLAMIQLAYRRFDRGTMWQQLADSLAVTTSGQVKPRATRSRRAVGLR